MQVAPWGLGRSFRDAASGALEAWRDERNMRIHAAFAVGAAWAGWVLELAPVEWAVLSLTVGAVLALEAMNTALEMAVDLACQGDEQALARLAKNAAAAGVFVAAVASVAVGVALFGPRLHDAGASFVARAVEHPWAMGLWAAGFLVAAIAALLRLGGGARR